MEISSKGGRRALKAVAVLAGFVALVIGIQDRRALSRIQSLGTPAIVAPPHQYTETRSRGGTTYTAEFTFKTESGQTITRRRSFPEEVLADFRNGVPVKAKYDPRDPSEFVWDKEKGSWWGVGLGAGVMLAALLFL